ncbi:methyltransferase domain-containing protein [Haladaptatus sp. AB643]|uniref:class I SAM-dependent methyltransferase n=1 Tax=Haladaptatus sp. AB643 TaxID=2934174 RepID=UPI00209C391D|nr:class I SAM-dependent methyltransferase [Haladaptatus sp. AB643]
MGNSYFQTYYSWPGLREHLPDLDGAEVLLAGCGRGDHVEFYSDHGATVTGVDVSEEAIAQARDHHPNYQFEVADVPDGLPFDDEVFDVAVVNLVLSHIAEWRPVLDSFRRVLHRDGAFVVATIHPAYQRQHWDLDQYAERVEVVVDWGATELPSYYRPMSEIIRSFLDTEFTLVEIAEPMPKGSKCDPLSPENIPKSHIGLGPTIFPSSRFVAECRKESQYVVSIRF